MGLRADQRLTRPRLTLMVDPLERPRSFLTRTPSPPLRPRAGPPQPGEGLAEAAGAGSPVIDSNVKMINV